MLDKREGESEAPEKAVSAEEKTACANELCAGLNTKAQICHSDADVMEAELYKRADAATREHINVDVYENTAKSTNNTEFPSGRNADDGVVDAKLEQFFVLASSDGKGNARRVKIATDWKRGTNSKWRYEEPTRNGAMRSRTRRRLSRV